MKVKYKKYKQKEKTSSFNRKPFLNLIWKSVLEIEQRRFSGFELGVV